VSEVAGRRIERRRTITEFNSGCGTVGRLYQQSDKCSEYVSE
jgi:hypothetical protein